MNKIVVVEGGGGGTGGVLIRLCGAFHVCVFFLCCALEIKTRRGEGGTIREPAMLYSSLGVSFSRSLVLYVACY